MTIDEAIKVLTIWKEEGEGESEKLEIAENMGIEALKYIREYRQRGIVNFELLPGETKE